MANQRRIKKSGKFKHNVINITGEYDVATLGAEAIDKNSRSITVYAKDYYKAHKRSIDKILDNARARTGRFQNQTNEEAFIGQVEDLLIDQSSFQKKSTLNDRVQGLLNEFQGIDPNLGKIKREAEFRDEAGFHDLRLLNKRVSNKEIAYNGPDNIVGYYDIKNSDYVIAHRLDYSYSNQSPLDVYEYTLRVDIGL